MNIESNSADFKDLFQKAERLSKFDCLLAGNGSPEKRLIKVLNDRPWRFIQCTFMAGTIPALPVQFLTVLSDT